MIVIGHRGSPGEIPEHTRSSYLQACDAGVDAVEPDLVVSRDGVLVVRHDSELSETTDIAERREFVGRRTTRRIGRNERSGWFAEDFDWDELRTLRCRERIPTLRPASAAHDGEEGILRLEELLELLSQHPARPGIVIEIKHYAHYRALGLDHIPLMESAVRAWDPSGEKTVLECFEESALEAVRERGIPGRRVYLMEHDGVAEDLDGGPGYAEQRAPEALADLARRHDGISLDKKTVLADPDVVSRARVAGLEVLTWTCRPENAFLSEPFRTGAPAEFGDYRGEWTRIRDTGVDGVFVDYAALGMEVFRE